MTRDSTNIPLDPEIERTISRIRVYKRRHAICASTCSVASTSTTPSHSTSTPPNLTFELLDNHRIMAEVVNEHERHEREHVENHDVEDNRTMEEINNACASFAPRGFYATPANFELKGDLLSHLPKFSGTAMDDAHKHLEALYSTCSFMKPRAAQLDDVLLRVFQFSLEGRAKEWLLNLPTHYATLSWDELKKAFLDRYFPASRVSRLRKDISGVSQHSQETLYEYWTRFNTLVHSCPNHNYTTTSLVQFFYDGLQPSLKISIDAAAQGSIFKLLPMEGWNLLSTMATNNQQFYSRDSPSVSEVATFSGQDKLYNMFDMLKNRMDKFEEKSSRPLHAVNMSQGFGPTFCDFCASPMHLSANCPTRYEEVSALYQQRPPYVKRDPYSNTYNEGWRDHPNFKWGGGGNNFPNRYQGNNQNFNPNFQPSQEIKRESNPSTSKFDDLVKMVESLADRMSRIETNNQNISTFVSQFANSRSEEEHIVCEGIIRYDVA